MAEGKNKIIIYKDWFENFESLTDEEAGKLIKHFFRYVNDLDPEAPDRMTELLFVPIKQTLKRDLKKWEQIVQKRSDAGKASAEARKQKPKTEPKEQNPTNSTSVKSVEQNSTKSTDKDNDSDNDIDIVTVRDKDIVIKKDNILLSSLDFQSKEVQQNEFNRISFSYWQLFKANAKTKKTKNLDKATLEDWSRTVRLMIDNDERTLEEIQSVYKYLKVDEFWKANCQSIHKVREKFETLYSRSKSTNNGTRQQTATERNREDSEASTNRLLEKLQIDLDKNQQS